MTSGGRDSNDSGTPPGIPIDPWAEQARRRAARLRRRRIRIALAVGVVLVIAWVGVAVWILVDRESRSEESEPVDSTGLPAGTASSTAASAVPSDPLTTSVDSASASTTLATTSAEDLVEVEEVWLLGHEDGSVHWGAIVRSIDEQDRAPIRIDASFRTGAGREVAARTETLAALAAGGRAVVGGVIGGDAEPFPVPPVAIQVAVSVGRPTDDPVVDDGIVAVRGVERRTTGGGEELVGRVESGASEEIADLEVAAVWRGERGEVIGAVFRHVDVVRPLVAARFAVDLEGLELPDGPPADTYWSLDGDG